MSLGMEVGLGPGNIVLDGDQALPHSSPLLFGPLCFGTVAHLSNCSALVVLPYAVYNTVLPSATVGVRTPEPPSAHRPWTDRRMCFA